MTNANANQSVTSKVSRKRAKAEYASKNEVGVKRKSPISLGKFSNLQLFAFHWLFMLFIKTWPSLRSFNEKFLIKIQITALKFKLHQKLVFR